MRKNNNDVDSPNYRYRDVRDAFEMLCKTKVPIRKGCRNKQCFCTGACDEIIGYRDKLPNEN